ncbi:MAG: prepilin-type N-terminal cleavage/methylation domain-containing protein, partial [Bacilli bacterium]|nr:prepilin-type N-terminal cleavage/methylation domain-containing protein [Bacilli bacterium]
MNKNKKGFTLVELLAVIVILAVILIIAVPQIMKTIKTTRLKSIEDSARLIATNADKDYLSQQAVNANYNATSIPCSDVAKLSDDYSSCSITYDSNGVSTVKLKGASGGKFNNIRCLGTKDNMKCKEIVTLPGYTDAVEYLTQKYNNGTNSEGLIQTNGTELRYQGSNPNNYVYFNCTDNLNPTSSTCEIWRIVGVFDNRVKLVRKDSIRSFSWDTSESTINNGYGINQWGPSGTYEGADLMRELNGDYLNYNLSANANWYNGSNNSLGSGNFNKNYVLKESAQELIGEATWYTGGVPYNSTVTLADAYAGERGEQGKMCSSGTYCTDNVERTYTWIGKVGLIYPSDYGYASGNSSCAANLVSGNC